MICATKPSRSISYANEFDFGIGAPVDTENILSLANRGSYAKPKEAHARVIGTSSRRPETISVTGENLSESPDLIAGGSRALRRLVIDNMSAQNQRLSSYYLGLANGRVVDRKKSNLSLYELSNWMDDVFNVIEATPSHVTCDFINTFSIPVNQVPSTDPISVVVDLTFLGADKIITVQDQEFTISPQFYYLDYLPGQGFQFPDITNVFFTLHFDGRKNKLIYSSSESVMLEGRSFLHLLNDSNNTEVKALYQNGTTYIGDSFFSVQLPTDRPFDLDKSIIKKSFVPIDELLSNTLTEKGRVSTTSNEFDQNSVFHLIDKLKKTHEQNVLNSVLGSFHNYLPDCDLILCTDMGTEPADFILSSPTKLICVHIKCGEASDRPESSAGAIAVVGSQAFKNLEFLISRNTNLRPHNWTNLQSKWPKATENVYYVDDRVRLFDAMSASVYKQQHGINDNQLLKDVWQEITNRRISNSVEKEIWIVMGNSFSYNHFKSQLSAGNAVGESLQAFQLISNWIGVANNNDVRLLIFTSP